NRDERPTPHNSAPEPVPPRRTCVGLLDLGFGADQRDILARAVSRIGGMRGTSAANLGVLSRRLEALSRWRVQRRWLRCAGKRWRCPEVRSHGGREEPVRPRKPTLAASGGAAAVVLAAPRRSRAGEFGAVAGHAADGAGASRTGVRHGGA